jgi:hypothetical protein
MDVNWRFDFDKNEELHDGIDNVEDDLEFLEQIMQEFEEADDGEPADVSIEETEKLIEELDNHEFG